MVLGLPELLRSWAIKLDDLITIRQMLTDDVPVVFEWRNDPRVRKYMFNSSPLELDCHVAWFEKTHQDPQRYPLLVCRNEQPFGFVQFNVSGCGAVADWGFYVDPDGPKGQGTMLGRPALNFGFNKLSLDRICGHVLAGNPRSLAFHAQLGFTLEGVLRSHHLSVSGYQDVHLFGVLIKEWTGA